MKGLLTKLGMTLLVYLLDNPTVHNVIRDAAKKTSNKYDDAAVEAAIMFLKQLSTLLAERKSG